MKFHADQPDQHTITAYGEGWVAINGERHHQSLLLSSSGIRLDWNCGRFEELVPAHFEAALTLTDEAPELLVFGSGDRLRFVPPAMLQGLIGRNIGVETMDTPAACRTYNILAAEGRRVVVALLIEA